MNCPICSSSDTKGFYYRPNVPIFQQVVCTTKQEASSIKRGILDYLYCVDCSFVFNQAFKPLNYKQALYSNSPQYSDTYQKHLESIIRKLDLSGRVLEIGCGDGYFLNLIHKMYPNLKCYGVDPAVKPIEIGDNLSLMKDYWKPGIISDILISRHLIEHLPNPSMFLKEIASSPELKTLYLETPDVEWIIDHLAVWDMFFEHCSLFSFSSLQTAIRKAGMYPRKIEKVFNNQFLFSTIVNSDADQPDYIFNEDKYFSFQERSDKKINHLSMKLYSLEGSVAIWGCGAKGATISNLFPDAFVCGLEINPNKIGSFLPGSALPIRDFRDSKDIKKALLMNPNYKQEAQKLISDNNLDIELLVLQ